MRPALPFLVPLVLTRGPAPGTLASPAQTSPVRAAELPFMPLCPGGSDLAHHPTSDSGSSLGPLVGSFIESGFCSGNAVDIEGHRKAPVPTSLLEAQTQGFIGHTQVAIWGTVVYLMEAAETRGPGLWHLGN